MTFDSIKRYFQKIFDSIDPSSWFIIALVFLVFIGMGIGKIFEKPPDPLQSPEIAKIYDMGAIKIGVRQDILGFSSINPKTQQLEGLEIDIAVKIAQNIFGDEYSIDKIEFIPVDFSNRTSKLQTERLDMLISLCEKDYYSDFAFTQSYYTDAIGIIALKDGPEIIADLQGVNIGAVVRPGKLLKNGALTVLNNYAIAGELNIKIVEYPSFPDLIEALEKTKIQAIAVENSLIGIYFNESTMQVLPEAIGKIDYSVAVKLSNKPLLEIAEKTIKQLKEEGVLDQLYAKWGLKNFQDIN